MKKTWFIPAEIPAGILAALLLAAACDMSSGGAGSGDAGSGDAGSGPSFTVTNRSGYTLELRLGENEFGEIIAPLTALDTPDTRYPEKVDTDDWNGDGDTTDMVRYKVDRADFRVLVQVAPNSTKKVALESGASETPLAVFPVWSKTVAKDGGQYKLSFVSTQSGVNEKTLVAPAASGGNAYTFPPENVDISNAFTAASVRIPYALVKLVNNHLTEAAALVSGQQRTRAVFYRTIDFAEQVPPLGQSGWYEVPWAEVLPSSFLQTTSLCYWKDWQTTEGIPALFEKWGIMIGGAPLDGITFPNPTTTTTQDRDNVQEATAILNGCRTGRIRMNLQIGIVPGLNGGYEILTGVRDPELFTRTEEEELLEAETPGSWFPTGRPIPQLEPGGVYTISYDTKPSGSAFNSTTYKPRIIDSGVRLTAAEFF